MAVEIEHKYLVLENIWDKEVAHDHMVIRQGYLQTDPNKTIRVRTKGPQGYLTIKGKAVGASRPEFEYEIPVEEANELLNHFCTNLIDKTRYYVVYEGKTWEVDVFGGLNEGLVVAEIELSSEGETYSLPSWAGENVTTDMRYANSNLTINPFSMW
ncbi:CYTH domain-containing protein [Pedobacter xixiisoli]|uniref:Adenylate cyclase n=1 Tax=Pedobacter xixiisoli TaxID=1476464 RepID=A0A285ZZU7_9SPHI|nr:CYTH domain-containing protein [Pedobacter xixiisoli]SOD15165.1 adenylate cyclase [Pedobacter xixiisoli]